MIQFETATICSLNNEMSKIKAVTWDRIRTEMMSDPKMIALVALVSQGLPQHRKDMPSEISEYHKYKDSIYNIDGVLMCGDCILIPPMLREEVLKC